MMLSFEAQAMSFPTNLSALAEKLGKQDFVRGLFKGTQADRDQDASLCLQDFDQVTEGIDVLKAELENPNYAKIMQTAASVAGQGASVFNDCHMDSGMMSFTKMTSSLSGLLDGGINTMINVFYESDVDTSDFAELVSCYEVDDDTDTVLEECGEHLGGVLAIFLNYEVPEATLTFDITGTVFEKYVN